MHAINQQGQHNTRDVLFHPGFRGFEKPGHGKGGDDVGECSEALCKAEENLDAGGMSVARSIK